MPPRSLERILQRVFFLFVYLNITLPLLSQTIFFLFLSVTYPRSLDKILQTIFCGLILRGLMVSLQMTSSSGRFVIVRYCLWEFDCKLSLNLIWEKHKLRNINNKWGKWLCFDSTKIYYFPHISFTFTNPKSSNKLCARKVNVCDVRV